MTKFADLYNLPEDERIELIGHTLMDAPMSSADKPLVVGIVVEDYAKASRYIEKLWAKFPDVRLLYRGPGPVAGTVLIKLSGPLR